MSSKKMIQKYDRKNQQIQPQQDPIRRDHVTGLPVSHFTGKNQNVNDIALIEEVSRRYGLDPAGKEVIILRGGIYMTAKAINRISTNDPKFNGVTTEIIHEDWKKNFFVVKAMAWRKGEEHPVEDYADSDGSQMKGGNLFRHTITRAKARALRSAFAIPYCSVEEMEDPNKEHIETDYEEIGQPLISTWERSILTANSLEELADLWASCPCKTALEQVKEDMKEMFSSRKFMSEEATPIPEPGSDEKSLELSGKIHAILAKRFGSDAHIIARIMGGEDSYKDAPSDRISSAIHWYEDHEKNERIVRDIYIEAEKVILSKKEGEERDDVWRRVMLPEWRFMSPAERLFLWSARGVGEMPKSA